MVQVMFATGGPGDGSVVMNKHPVPTSGEQATPDAPHRRVWVRGCLGCLLVPLLACTGFLLLISLLPGSPSLTQTLAIRTPLCGSWNAETGPQLGSYISSYAAVAGASPADL